MVKKVLVVSHERSGTHFLINSIASNFGSYVPNQIDVDGTQRVNWADTAEAARWWDQYRGRPVRNIFKSHHDVAFFRPLLDRFADEYRIFYLHRDGRDVMTSFWRYLNMLKPGWGPQTATVGDFMRAYPSGSIVQYQSKYYLTMLERWAAHTTGWHDAGSQVCIVGYEALHRQFSETMARVAQHLGASPVRSPLRPSLDSPSSLPWRGEIGNWKQYFADDDVNYFSSRAGSAMARLGYDCQS